MLDFVLDFLFPPVCGICGKLDKNWICNNCKKRLEKYEKFELVKGKYKIDKLFNFKDKNSNVQILENNLKFFNNDLNDLNNINDIYNINNEYIYFEEFFYCYEYKNLVRNLLLKYKFSDCAYLSNLFANVILNNKKVNEIFKNYDIIIPVPMDKIKKKTRGYNQTELITNIFEKKINFNNDYTSKKNNVLIKNKVTKTQSTLNAEERIQNIKDVFEVKDKKIIENKKIILFDDIATTGSTINEISKILKNAGASKILVLVIAKD